MSAADLLASSTRYVIRERGAGETYWNNEAGWVDNRESATVFSEAERDTYALPMGDSYWEEVKQ